MKANGLLCILAMAAVGLSVGCEPAAEEAKTASRPAVAPQRDVNIQALIDRAPDGAVVTIPVGEYVLPGSLLVEGRKALTLRGEPGTRVLTANVDLPVLKLAKCGKITVRGLFLRHVKPLTEYNCHGPVVRVDDCQTVEIVNCELNGCGAIGVSARGTKDVLVQHCHVHHNTFNAFYFDRCGEVKLAGNLVEDNANFMQTYRTDSLEMQDNVIRRNGGYWSPRDEQPGLEGNDGRHR